MFFAEKNKPFWLDKKLLEISDIGWKNVVVGDKRYGGFVEYGWR